MRHVPQAVRPDVFFVAATTILFVLRAESKFQLAAKRLPGWGQRQRRGLEDRALDRGVVGGVAARLAPAGSISTSPVGSCTTSKIASGLPWMSGGRIQFAAHLGLDLGRCTRSAPCCAPRRPGAQRLGLLRREQLAQLALLRAAGRAPSAPAPPAPAAASRTSGRAWASPPASASARAWASAWACRRRRSRSAASPPSGLGLHLGRRLDLGRRLGRLDHRRRRRRRVHQVDRRRRPGAWTLPAHAEEQHRGEHDVHQRREHERAARCACSWRLRRAPASAVAH